MGNLGSSTVIGLCLGFFWGIGCSLAILYSIYLGGYRKAIEDSQAAVKPKRYLRALEKIRADREKSAPSQ
jgi:hypothetical protein